MRKTMRSKWSLTSFGTSSGLGCRGARRVIDTALLLPPFTSENPKGHPPVKTSLWCPLSQEHGNTATHSDTGVATPAFAPNGGIVNAQYRVLSASRILGISWLRGSIRSEKGTISLLNTHSIH
jgi:hypothetical protein